MDNKGEDEKNLWQADQDQPTPAEQTAEQPVDQSEQIPDQSAEATSETPAESPITDQDQSESKTPIAPVEIRWTASDSIEHERGKGWYATVAAATLAILAGLAALWFFGIMELFAAITTGILVVIMLVTLLVVTRKPAHEVEYLMTDSGITMDGKLHPFAEFRAFGVQPVGVMWQLALIPVKRFGINVTMFIQEDQGEQIVDALGARLPMENVKNDLVDNIIRRLKI